MAGRIGYACKALGVPQTAQKSCIVKNATDELLIRITEHNLDVLENMIDYNIENNIKLFRISSGVIPFGSSSVNSTPWQDIFKERLLQIGNKINSSGMRVSMHPGQYTVLNSPSDFTVKNAAADLDYHADVLNSLNVDDKNKIILHIGGIYGDKKQAVLRFYEQYKRLTESIRKRLVIENDDRNYTIEDVLEIGEKLNIPVVFDTLHNKINPSNKFTKDLKWIEECAKTWQYKDGPQKIHYSQQDYSKKAGAHSNTISIVEFMKFYENIINRDLDIMLEVKDKNLSAVKCINCINKSDTNSEFEKEWGKYKFAVLEKSPEIFKEISDMFKSKENINPIEFYKFIESALAKNNTSKNSMNAAKCIWKYYFNSVPEYEETIFNKKINEYKNGNLSLTAVKNFLYRLSIKYKEDIILNSYYFIF